MTLVEFRQVLTESSPKPVESIFVKDDYGKAYVGGLRLDSIICKYFEEIFQQKYKKKLDKRGLIKLLAESNKVKETLSSNK
jgi:molecular chaperone DnaK (HSP70)